MRNGWAPTGIHIYCKVLYRVNKTPCILTTNGNMYEMHIPDDIVPLDQWTYPDVITTQVVRALSTFLSVVQLCDGVPIGRDAITSSKSTNIRVHNGLQYMKHIRCPVVMPLLNKGTFCEYCRKMYHNRVVATSKAVTPQQVSRTINTSYICLLCVH